MRFCWPSFYKRPAETIKHVAGASPFPLGNRKFQSYTRQANCTLKIKLRPSKGDSNKLWPKALVEGLVHSPPKESKPRVSEKLAAFREQRAQRTELALLSLPELPQDVAAEVLRAAWQMANFGSTNEFTQFGFV